MPKVNADAATRVTIGGVTKTAKEWGEESTVDFRTIAERAQRGVHESLLLAPGRTPPRRTKPAWSGACDKPYADDPVAQVIVGLKPFGMSLEEVGLCLGLSRERVRQIEAMALASVRDAARQMGLEDDLRGFLEDFSRQRTDCA